MGEAAVEVSLQLPLSLNDTHRHDVFLGDVGNLLLPAVRKS